MSESDGYNPSADPNLRPDGNARAIDVSGLQLPPKKEGPAPAFQPEPELAELLAAEAPPKAEADPRFFAQGLNVAEMRAELARAEQAPAENQPQTSETKANTPPGVIQRMIKLFRGE